MHFIASLQLCKYCSCQVQTITDSDNKSNFKEIFGAAPYTLQLPATTCHLVSKHVFFLLQPVIANESIYWSLGLYNWALKANMSNCTCQLGKIHISMIHPLGNNNIVMVSMPPWLIISGHMFSVFVFVLSLFLPCLCSAWAELTSGSRLWPTHLPWLSHMLLIHLLFWVLLKMAVLWFSSLDHWVTHVS